MDVKRFAIMYVAYRLGLSEEEILGWTIGKFERWCAFFRIIEPKQKRGRK